VRRRRRRRFENDVWRCRDKKRRPPSESWYRFYWGVNPATWRLITQFRSGQSKRSSPCRISYTRTCMWTEKSGRHTGSHVLQSHPEIPFLVNHSHYKTIKRIIFAATVVLHVGHVSGIFQKNCRRRKVITSLSEAFRATIESSSVFMRIGVQMDKNCSASSPFPAVDVRMLREFQRYFFFLYALRCIILHLCWGSLCHV